MKKKVISIILGIYFGITLLLFCLEVYFQFGNPLFIIGLDFSIFGIISIKYFTYGYLITTVGLCILLYTLNIWKIDWYFFRYIIVMFFPIVPGFVLFSEKNDKRRFFRKGCSEVEAICKGTDSYGCYKFEYYLNNKKYVGISYKEGKFNYREKEKVKIYVLNENPEKIFVDMTEKQIKLVKRITIFLSIFATFIIFLMLYE